MSKIGISGPPLHFNRLRFQPRKGWVLLLLGLAAACGEADQVEVPPEVELGTGEPEAFLPGIANPTGPVEGLAMSPEGQSIFLVRASGGATNLELTRWTEQGFTPPVTLPFGRPGMDRDPQLSPDGEWLYFASRRPLPQAGAADTTIYNLWRASRSPDGWGEAEPLEGVNHPEFHDRGPALSGDGTLVFASERSGRGSDLWLAEPTELGFHSPVNPGPPVNTSAWESDPYLAPDASFVIFVRREAAQSDPGGVGVPSSGGDLYFSRQQTGGWTSPEALAGGVNSENDEFAPFVSPGGEYLFFNRGAEAIWWVPTRSTGIPLGRN
ncbi:MAG: hypothetical protein WEA09_12690 [Gemmatimonadota bacterium]